MSGPVIFSPFYATLVLVSESFAITWQKLPKLRLSDASNTHLISLFVNFHELSLHQLRPDELCSKKVEWVSQDHWIHSWQNHDGSLLLLNHKLRSRQWLRWKQIADMASNLGSATVLVIFSHLVNLLDLQFPCLLNGNNQFKGSLMSIKWQNSNGCSVHVTCCIPCYYTADFLGVENVQEF